MKMEYKIMSEKEDLGALKEDLEEQRDFIEGKIRRIESKDKRDRLVNTLGQLQDISTALIPLQQSLNVIWKRTQQMETEIKKLIEEHQ